MSINPAIWPRASRWNKQGFRPGSVTPEPVKAYVATGTACGRHSVAAGAGGPAFTKERLPVILPPKPPFPRARFPRNNAPQGLGREAFQTENALKLQGKRPLSQRSLPSFLRNDHIRPAFLWNGRNLRKDQKSLCGVQKNRGCPGLTAGTTSRAFSV